MKRDAFVGAFLLAVLIGVSMLGHRPEGPKAATHASVDYSFGGYRAWYELLAREGVSVGRLRRHHDALRESKIDTLIVAFPDDGEASSWSASEHNALRAWVRGGGRLVDIGEWPPESSEDPKGELVYLEKKAKDQGALHGPWAALVGSLGDRGVQRLVPVKHAPVDTLLADRSGPLVVRYRYGRGEVIGVATPAFFENRALGRGDDARLAYLVGRPGHGGVVAFDEAVRGDVVEKPWYQALDAPVLLALAVAALAGLLWLLYGIIPLGPPVRLRAAREPTSEEFVDAVAALYERARARDHARDALVTDARRALERAPRTAANTALAARVAAAATAPLANDAALVALATIARTARQEIIRGSSPDNHSHALARRAGARRRRR
jgi:hypothetical protein